MEWRFGIAVLAISVGAIMACPAIAQISSDNSTGTIVTPTSNVYDITGGTTIGGRNLFHSFSRFDIPTQGIANFLNDPGVVNIFSRVTGGKVSEIDGVLRSRGTANLFLMNPSGIVFGQNARLDIGGSFVATTANVIQFGEQGFFSATSPESVSPVLKVDPSALIFSSQLLDSGQIRVQGNGQGTRINTDLIDTQNALRVQGNRTLALVGGNLDLESATLKTAGGRIELGSVSPGSSVKLTPIRKGWALDYTGVQNFRDMKLTQRSTVDSSGAGSGDIQVQGRHIQLLEGSQIEASTLGTESGGTLRLTASDSIRIQSPRTSQYPTGLYSEVYNTASGSGGEVSIETKNLTILDGAVLVARTFGSGQGGTIFIKAQNVRVSNGSFVLASTFSTGKGGNLIIHADELVEIIGTDRVGKNTVLEANVYNNFGAQGGSLTIETRKLRVIGSQLSASLFGSGKSGDLRIQATDSVELSGEIPGDTKGFPGGLFAIVNPNSEGRAGNLTIDTKRLSISDGSKAQTLTFGNGNSGELRIKADELEVFETEKRNYFETGIFTGVGFDPRNTTLAKGQGGELNLEVARLSIRGGSISVATSGIGDAGRARIQVRDRIDIQPSSDEIKAASRITGNVFANATGRGGTLLIQTNSIILRGQNSSISSEIASGGIGQGGDIDVQAKSVEISARARISAQSNGNGQAGNIRIGANNRLNLNNGRIFTSSVSASGGQIEINAGKVRLSQDSEISSSVSSGNNGGGNIRIDANYVLALDDSDIFAFSRDGQGGTVILDGPFFAVGFQPEPLQSDPSTLQNNNRPDVYTNGTVSLLNDVQLQNSLAQLPRSAIDTNTLLANSCIVRNNRASGSFYVTGSGNLPANPNDSPVSSYSTGTVESISANSASNSDRSWKKGDAIVEPQGVYQLLNGKLVLSRECS